MRREFRTLLRSLIILARAGSKDFCQRLKLELFKRRRFLPYENWRDARERKKRLARRARVASSSRRGVLEKQLRFPRLFEPQQVCRDLAACANAVLESGNNPIAFDFGEKQFSPLGVGETLKDRRDAQDRWHISRALNITNWNKAAAARMLGTSRQNLHERMKALGLLGKKP